MHLVQWFMILCLTIFLHNAEGVGLMRGVYYVLFHNHTQKVVASDGTLFDYGEENWEKWSAFPNPAPYYYLKSGLNSKPREFPHEAGKGSKEASLVLGSQNECKPSKGNKVNYKPNNPSQQWKIKEEGVNPIYNRCKPPLQLTVKGNRIYLEKPEIVKGDPNGLFQLVPSVENAK